MVGRATVEKESEADEVDFMKIRSDDFTKLSKVVGGRYLLSIDGINQLSIVYDFSQIRFRCNKPYHGRTLDIKTTTTSVTFKTSRPPPSCTQPRIIILTRRPSCLRPTSPSTFSHRTNPNQNVNYVNSSTNASKKKNDLKSVILSF